MLSILYNIDCLLVFYANSTYVRALMCCCVPVAGIIVLNARDTAHLASRSRNLKPRMPMALERKR